MSPTRTEPRDTVEAVLALFSPGAEKVSHLAISLTAVGDFADISKENRIGSSNLARSATI